MTTTAELSAAERQAYKIICRCVRASTTKVAREANLSQRTAYEVLSKLCLCSLVERDGYSGSGCEVIWRRLRVGELSPIDAPEPEPDAAEIAEYRRRYAVIARVRREAEAKEVYPATSNEPIGPYLEWLDRELAREEHREEVA
jgi:hypothetical protein